MPQVSTKEVTLNAIMRRPGFQQGMLAAAKGEPFRTDFADKVAEWDYERGRLFHVATGQKYLHIKRGPVSKEQQLLFAKLLKERTIL